MFSSKSYCFTFYISVCDPSWINISVWSEVGVKGFLFLCHTWAWGCSSQPGLNLTPASEAYRVPALDCQESPTGFCLFIFLRYSLLLHLLGSKGLTILLNWTWAFVINPRTCIWTLYPTHLFICLEANSTLSCQLRLYGMSWNLIM